MRFLMLVGDNEDDIDLTLMALQKNHIANDIIVARDGEEALDYLMNESRKTVPSRLPAVVLLGIYWLALNKTQGTII
jgi:two-component system, response regulator